MAAQFLSSLIMRDVAIGIDIGTTGVKAIAVQDNGTIVFESSRGHDLISPKAGFAEEDPGTWWANIERLLSDISQNVDTSRVSGIAFSGMVPTLILVDDDGNAIRNSIQQNDARATREIDELRQSLDNDAYFARTGNTVNQQVVFPKYAWLKRNEPESISRARYIMGSYDYCAYKLCGNPTLERNWALESGMWLVEDERWDTEILSAIGISEDLLPPVRESGDVIGETSPEVHRKTGFPSGVPVMCGIADHVASALATGVRSDGDLLLKLGGAGDILFATNTLALDRRMFIDYHPMPGTYLINGCMAASGSIVKWITNLTQDTDMERLTREAELLGPDSSEGQIVVLPYFLGEKTPIFDTNARGVIFGLSLNHSRASLFRAVLESVAFGFRHHVDVLRDMGLEVTSVYLSNGGARSPLWKQIVLDVIGMDGTYVPDHPGSCIGAAFVVHQKAIRDHNWGSLRNFLSKGRLIRFSEKHHHQYSHFYDVYRDLYENLKHLFPRLSMEDMDE